MGKIRIQAVKAKDIDLHINGLINEEKLSYSSIEKVLDVLNAAFSWAKLMEKWDTNPVEKIKPSLAKNRNKDENDNKYIAVEGTTKNEKAREIRLTDEALNVLKIIKSQKLEIW